MLDKLKVVSDEEAEKMDYLVCMPATAGSPFDDNLTGFCSECGVKVIFRWHAPRQPKRICIRCVPKVAEREEKEARERHAR